jgi:hypothetical protein
MKHGNAIHFVHTHIHVIPFIRFGLLINIILLLLLFLGIPVALQASDVLKLENCLTKAFVQFIKFIS